MSVPLTPSADKNWITARWACLEESMVRSLTVISRLFQSTTHCRYRVYTKFFLTYTAISRRNRKVSPLGITALQPQSHIHLGTPYSCLSWELWDNRNCVVWANCRIFIAKHLGTLTTVFQSRDRQNVAGGPHASLVPLKCGQRSNSRNTKHTQFDKYLLHPYSYKNIIQNKLCYGSTTELLFMPK
jgi:hypothetical protein